MTVVDDTQDFVCKTCGSHWRIHLLNDKYAVDADLIECPLCSIEKE